jgi:hypothetical protein
MNVRDQARTDALRTARIQLETERAAERRCADEGWEFDRRAAAQEVRRLEALIARLEGNRP